MSSSGASSTPVPVPQEPDREKKAEQMALRQQERGALFVGGGVAYNSNDADKLGAPLRRRRASRALLGG